MQDSARQYLEAQVTSATPQKLRLMLIEGAIRWARTALDQWERKMHEEAVESLIHCRSIIAELLVGVQVDGTELTRQVAGLYVFLFRHVTEAQLRRSRSKVEEILSVLEIERETWRLVCERLPAEAFQGPGTNPQPPARAEIAAPAKGIDGPATSLFAVDA